MPMERLINRIWSAQRLERRSLPSRRMKEKLGIILLSNLPQPWRAKFKLVYDYCWYMFSCIFMVNFECLNEWIIEPSLSVSTLKSVLTQNGNIDSWVLRCTVLMVQPSNECCGCVAPVCISVSCVRWSINAWCLPD